MAHPPPQPLQCADASRMVQILFYVCGATAMTLIINASLIKPLIQFMVPTKPRKEAKDHYFKVLNSIKTDGLRQTEKLAYDSHGAFSRADWWEVRRITFLHSTKKWEEVVAHLEKESKIKHAKANWKKAKLGIMAPKDPTNHKDEPLFQVIEQLMNAEDHIFHKGDAQRDDEIMQKHKKERDSERREKERREKGCVAGRRPILRVNTAFVFVKPEANTPGTVALLTGLLEGKGLEVKKTGTITAEEIDSKRLADNHYYSIGAKASCVDFPQTEWP